MAMQTKDIRKTKPAPASARKPEPEPARNPRAVAGDNKPPLFDLDDLRAQLNAQTADDEKDLVGILEDARKLPSLIATKEDADAATGLIKECRAFERDMEGTRKKEGQIFTSAKALVDTTYNGKKERAKKCGDVLYSRLNAYNRAELERQRQAREAEEKALREAAEKAAAKAAAAAKPATKAAKAAEAAELETQAEEAASRTQESAADMTRTRTDSGAMRTTKTETKVAVDDFDQLDLNKLRPYIKRDELERAVRQWAKLTGYKEKMDGVRIFEEENVSVI